jgi:predicted phage gp36 major capsid-like protein
MTAESDKPAAPFEMSAESFQKLSSAINQAAERGQAAIETGLRTWEAEMGHYFEELQTHGRATLEALGKCKGPMDVLAVEQEWLKARSQAYLDSGMRFAKAFAEIARTVPGEAEAAAPKKAETGKPAAPRAG